MIADAEAPSRRADALLAAALFAIDPLNTRGVVLHALPGIEREAWLGALRKFLAPGAPLRRIPLHISDSRLLGGLDLAATLNAGRPIAERGVLAQADGGVVLLSMAERVSKPVAARIATVLDTREVLIERDGLALNSAARIGLVALDESIEADEQVEQLLQDRLAFHVDLTGLRLQDFDDRDFSPAQLEAARIRLPAVRSHAEIETALCATASALGIESIRAVLLCHAVARAAAALDERDEISQADAALAARLVLAPRATALPSFTENEAAPSPGENQAQDEQQDQPSDEPTANDAPDAASAPESSSSSVAESGDVENSSADSDQPLMDVVLAAAVAAIPSGLLAQLKLPATERSRASSNGRAGALRKSFQRGRSAGIIAAEPRDGVRLNVIETLRAAAPWQRLRRLESEASRTSGTSAARLQIRRTDLRINRYKQRSQTTTIFALDASGSAALNRLAETKGAVELLLNDCYVRRDRVAVIAFRGRTAELLLPPTRSLARAKRSLAGMPGGGGTPLAAGIEAAADLAETVIRAGDSPTIVLLTDGRANIAFDGSNDRKRAESDSLNAARRIALAGFRVLFIDTSPRAQPIAERLAQAMCAVYLSLPYADAGALSGAVKAANISAASVVGR
jgi:magnesium chelatase subunit D